MSEAALSPFTAFSRPWKRRTLLWMAGLTVLLSSAGLAWALWRGPDNSDILRIANSYPNGGGYCALSDSGVPEAITHKGTTILKASNDGGSYCCGFTFLVAMKAAEERGLLRDKHPYEVKRFQREWYGATKASAERQLALALENLGIGREIHPLDAAPGDFVAYQRPGDAGHSVVFLEWVKHKGTIVGFKYRSSQPTTDGVGDTIEFFTTSGYRYGRVDPNRFYVGRLD